ncbi:MAG: AbrB/MazE/SpoVT family DNA-binding domain-containing protein [Candidatus Bathyarchaeia archaeon]|nr:AbrB/MazE/SpoVT family DNA-binding domain-containing protein [Candidatus Bathyarchaeota archaeon]
MVEKIRVGVRGQVVIPRRLRKKLKLEHGTILMVEETGDGLLLRPYEPVKEMKGLGRGIFGDPIKYQRRIREEWGAKKLEDRVGH